MSRDLGTLLLAGMLLVVAAPLRAQTLGELDILSRKAWGAAPMKPGARPQKLFNLTVHHTAVRRNAKRSLKRKLKGLQAFSQRSERLASGKMKKAWVDIPYHYYIGVGGRIGEGRDVGYAGDTNTNYDPADHIQIVLEGNFEREQPNAAQLKALENLLVALARKWKIPASRIKGHKDHASTACPGKNLQMLLPKIKKSVAARLGQ